MATLDESRDGSASEEILTLSAENPHDGTPKQSPLHQDINEKNILFLAENHGAEDGNFYSQPREPPAALSRPPEDDKILKGIVRNEVNDILQQGTFRSQHLSAGTLTTAANTTTTNQQGRPNKSNAVPPKTAAAIRGSTVDQKIDTNHRDTILFHPPEDDKVLKGIVRNEVNDLLQRGTFRSEHRGIAALTSVSNSNNISQQDRANQSDLAIASTFPRQDDTFEAIMGMIEHQKHQDAIMKGAVVETRNQILVQDETVDRTKSIKGYLDMDDRQGEASPFPNDGTSNPPSLHRERRVVPVTQPGAVAISSAQAFAAEQEEAFAMEQDEAKEGSSSGRDEEAGVLTLPQDYLLGATLVSERQDDHTKELVEAEPALEGLEAMADNQHCKRIVACILLFVIVVVAVPLAIFLPGLNSDEIVLDGVDQQFLACGTRDRYQADYRGLEVVTELGIECQAWSAQFPHQHEHTPDAYPDANLLKNYCRNPAGEGQPRAWCYTKDPNNRWAFCDVKFCNEEPYAFREECASTLLGGYDYRGNISVSATGKTCLPWNESSLPLNPRNFPKAGLEANYCRNPDSDQPYCFVDDPNNPKELCDIPKCETLFQGSEEKCHNCTKGQCGTQRLQMTDYRGPVNVTLQGYPCIFWKHTTQGPAQVEEFGLEENHCRNPSPDNTRGRPLCYVTKNDYDYCDVPVCEDDFVPRRFCGSDTTQQDDYRGSIKVTTSGKQCRPWTSEYAVLERFNPNDKPWDVLVGSYCRNPKLRSTALSAGTPSAIKVGAWCYVDADAAADERWEYCDVPSCKDCGTNSLAKEDYTGTVSKSRSGARCLPWEGREYLLVQENSTVNIVQEVEVETVLFQFGIREKHSLEENYCRNPLPYQRDTVFCFVDEEGGWEYCDVPDCEEPGMTTHTDCGSQIERQADYRGDTNTTVSGRPCRPWELQEEYMPELYPDAGLEGSYCRQPAGSSRLAAWCFVNETEKKWEYRDVPVCEER